MFFPDYQGVDGDDDARRVRGGMGHASSTRSPGLTVTEIIGSVLKGGVRGMYMMGENPFLSDPNINKVRKALRALDFLVVQDIFLTETAEFADVVLPASSYLEKDGTYTNTDRRVQLGRKALDPPGEARGSTGRSCRTLAQRLGLPTGTTRSPREVFDEIGPLTPTTRRSATTTSAPTASSTPTRTRTTRTAPSCSSASASTPTTGRRTSSRPSGCRAKELPDDEYPFVLNTAACSSTGTPAR